MANMIKSKSSAVSDPFAKKKFKFGKLKYILIVILSLIVIFMITSLILKYRLAPEEAFRLDSENLIEDGSFESFNQTAGDCCNTQPDKSKVFASKSNDAIEGTFSLKLTSENQCACIANKINISNFKDKYFVSFYYKGDNPRLCIWAGGDQKCLFNYKNVSLDHWSIFYLIMSYTNLSTASNIVFYADSDGTRTVTNYYDALEVHKLMAMDVKGPFSDTESYVIKTKADNNVNGEQISKDDATNEAYYLVKGKPVVTIKFPVYEIVIIIVIMLIITRLLLKQDRDKEEWE